MDHVEISSTFFINFFDFVFELNFEIDDRSASELAGAVTALHSDDGPAFAHTHSQPRAAYPRINRLLVILLLYDHRQFAFACFLLSFLLLLRAASHAKANRLRSSGRRITRNLCAANYVDFT